MFASLRNQLAGVVAIPVTPFDSEGFIDSAAYKRVLSRMVESGIQVVTPNGNTSEFYSLSVKERQQCVELSVSEVGSNGTVLAGVGHSIPEAVDDAKRAYEAGASAIMIHQPVHPFMSLEGWLDYHVAIASAVPQLGVVLYLRNARIDGETIARLADAAPNLVGIKYAVADPVRFATVLRECGRDGLVWIAGLAELSAPGYWAVGATGFTSGFANVAPSLTLQLLESLRASDTGGAMKIWELIRPFEELRALNDSENNVSVVKESLAQLGLCSRDVRPPVSVLGLKDRQLVTEMMEGWKSMV